MDTLRFVATSLLLVGDTGVLDNRLVEGFSATFLLPSPSSSLPEMLFSSSDPILIFSISITLLPCSIAIGPLNSTNPGIPKTDAAIIPDPTKKAIGAFTFSFFRRTVGAEVEGIGGSVKTRD